VFSAEKLPGKTYSQRELMTVIRKTCESYADSYPNVPVKDMLLMGQSGLGKTYLMHAMAKRLIQRGQNVLLISAYKFLDVARKAYMSGNVEELDTLMDADVLMIDDMGVEPLMENITIPQWFNLINERQLRGKGTILSTNLMEDELRRRYTERIASRLMNNTQCRLVQFAGEDVRRRAN
jgi:DNA replication protein DnaC